MSAVSLDLSAMHATSITPPGCLGFDPSVRAHPFDGQRGRELLAQSGIAPEQIGTIELLAGRRIETQWLVRDLQSALGIRVEVRESTDVRGMASRSKMWYLVGTTDICVQGSIIDQFVRSNGSFNLSGYSDPGIDAALDRARAASDSVVRTRIYAEVEQRVLNDALLIPIWWRFPERRYGLSVSATAAGITLRPREVRMGMTWTTVEVTLENANDTEVGIFNAVLAATLIDEYGRIFGSDPTPPRLLPATVAPRSSVSGTLYFKPMAATTRRLALKLPDVSVAGERVAIEVDISPP